MAFASARFTLFTLIYMNIVLCAPTALSPPREPRPKGAFHDETWPEALGKGVFGVGLAVEIKTWFLDRDNALETLFKRSL